MKTARKPTKDEQDLASTYRRLFTGSDDGRAVLADLMEQFPPNMPRFIGANKQFISCPLAAAFADGQRTMTARIEALIYGGSTFRHHEPEPS